MEHLRDDDRPSDPARLRGWHDDDHGPLILSRRKRGEREIRRFFVTGRAWAVVRRENDGRFPGRG